MAQYAVLIYTSDSAHAPDASGDDLAAHDAHAEAMAKATVAAYALTPRNLATSIRADAITDGTFIEAKEIVAGFYILEAPDLDAAIALARTNPVVAMGGGLEVRPVHSGGVTERPTT